MSLVDQCPYATTFTDVSFELDVEPAPRRLQLAILMNITSGSRPAKLYPRPAQTLDPYPLAVHTCGFTTSCTYRFYQHCVPKTDPMLIGSRPQCSLNLPDHLNNKTLLTRKKR